MDVCRCQDCLENFAYQAAEIPDSGFSLRISLAHHTVSSSSSPSNPSYDPHDFFRGPHPHPFPSHPYNRRNFQNIPVIETMDLTRDKKKKKTVAEECLWN
ncbi:hypothetical protein CDAR_398001 [Caerostris darwini]|uniref:Uncharacterized protein n=1 Tax=Caerostris darwini TaxID=1538125 RepID=A0AAV4MNZ2_9ARAC|nr:hypothetical protein CDAR_398001 [Caerostris darwini]